jgi:cysteinyl-tRNA synthetase
MLLGLLDGTHGEYLAKRPRTSVVNIAEVNALISSRAKARAEKNWAESDRIRDALAAMGVAIKDGKDADGKPVTTWEIAR